MKIKQRIFGAMLLISLVPIFLLAYFSFHISQENLRKQLMQNRILGMGWMNDKLSTELNQYAELFYQIEVNRKIKKELTSWSLGNGIRDSVMADIRKIFEEALNRNGNMRSVAVYHPTTGEGYLATRTSFQAEKWETADALGGRAAGLQTNLVVQRGGGDFIVTHQMKDFSTGRIIAVLLIRLNKYAFGEVIQESMQQGERACLLNDEGILLKEFSHQPGAAVEGDWQELLDKVRREEGEAATGQDAFYFYETIGKGKLQLLYVVPNQLIRNQLKDTVTVAVMVMVLSLGAAVLLSILFSEIISKPIIVLSQKMQKTDIHNFAAADTGNRKDEIGLLQTSFETMMLRNQELVAREYQSELEKKDAQLYALQAQINPHFIYNTLQVIGGMSVTGQSKEIYSVVTAFGDILRYAISFEQETVALDREITYLQSYISVWNHRFQNRLQFETQISGKAGQAQIPKLILQPIVENCMEHGLTPKGGEWKIRLTAQEEAASETIVITITDNGVGMMPEQLAEVRRSLASASENILNASAHIGLNNVQARIKLQSGSSSGVEIQSVPNQGCTITVRIRSGK